MQESEENGKEQTSIEDRVYELEKRVDFWQQEAARNMKRFVLIRDELVKFVDKYDEVVKELEELKRRYDAE